MIHLPGIGDLLNWGADTLLGPVKDAAMQPIKALASGLADAVGDLLATLGTLWVRVDTPNVWSQSGGTSSTVTFLHSEVATLVGLLAVLGILIGAGRLAWEQRADAGRDLVRGLIVLTLVTGCGVPMIGLLVAGSDAWAQSIVAGATNGTDFGRNITAMLALTGPATAPVLLIVCGLLAVVVSLAQIALLVFRAGMLVLLAGLLPVAASMTTTHSGREHFRKYCAWIVALVAYKPLAAIIYAAAFRLIGTHQLNAGGAGHILIGLSLMAMAVVALPALLRFLVPAVGALGHVGGGHASSAAAFALPTGAKMLAGRSGSGGASSAPSATGATAAGGAAASAAVPIAGAVVGGAAAVKQGATKAANHATNPTNGKST